MRKTIYVTRKLPGTALNRLKNKFKVILNTKDRQPTRQELERNLKKADGILCLLTDKIDSELLDNSSRLKIVSNYAVGFDNIDIKACTERKIAVTNTPEVLTETVAEQAFALMITIARRIVEADKFVRAGKYKQWAPELLLGSDVKGKTFGIIGLGRIGSALTQILVKGLSAKVIYTDIKRNKDFEKEYGAKYVAKGILLKTADFISIHVPLLPSTRHLIGAKELKMMKKTAYLVNTSRGPVIDEKALVSALKRKEIAGAGIDVFEFEPKVAPGLDKLDNVVLTPHIASATIETRSAMADLAVDALIDFFNRKQPKYLLNKEIWQ